MNEAAQTEIERLNNQIQTWNTAPTSCRTSTRRPAGNRCPHRLETATRNAKRMADGRLTGGALRGSERGAQHGPGQAGRGEQVNEGDGYFWSKVDVLGPSDCWLWRAALAGSGYGIYASGRLGKRRVYAHRYAYELTHGAIPEGMFCLHKCDNPQCVNPAHLDIGTCADNLQDMVSKRVGQAGRTALVCKVNRRKREGNS